MSDYDERNQMRVLAIQRRIKNLKVEISRLEKILESITNGGDE